MRRQIALLVAATTTLVMLAFVIPLAVLVDRTADSEGIVQATSRSQMVVPLVAAGDDEAAAEGAKAASHSGFAVIVRFPDGQAGGAALEPWVGGQRAEDIRSTRVRRLPDEGAVVDQPVVRGDGTAVISARVDKAVLNAGVRRAWAVLVVLGLVLVCLSLFVGDRLARSVTRPVDDLAAVADRLGRGDLDSSLEPSGPPEIREVGAALNSLAERIKVLLANERESIADLSHRLRTPVTALRLDAEALADPEERARLSGDVDHLVAQVDAVIQHARRPVRGQANRPRSCDLTTVVRERMAFWESLAREQGRPTTVELPPEPCIVRSAADEIAAALDALLDNVFAHTPEGSAITVRVRLEDGGGGSLLVRDEGPGLEGVDLRARGASGAGSTGLGLDIATRTARDSGGSASVTNSHTGTTVTLRLGAPGPPSTD